MSRATPLVAGTVAQAKMAGLASAATAVLDEDFVSPAFAEPFDDATPGIVFAVFPTVGRKPGGVNRCRPPKLIIRVSLPSMHIVLDTLQARDAVGALGDDGCLGSFATDPPVSTERHLHDLRAWESSLDCVADAVARGESAPQQLLLKTMYERLPWAMCRPTYAAIAPVFLRWIGA